MAWTATVNIRGPKGDKGDQGVQGDQGVKGDTGATGAAGTITSATASGLAAGAAPTVTLGGTPEARTFALGIPAGAAGTAATITSATATGLAAGANPTVTLGGTTTARTFAFGIPVGAQGIQGIQGVQGPRGDQSVIVALTYAATIATDASAGTLFRVTLTGNATLAAPTNPTDGQKVLWEVTASGADRTLTLATGAAGAFKFGTDITAVPVITSGTTTFLGAIYRTSSQRWHVLAVGSGH